MSKMYVVKDILHADYLGSNTPRAEVSMTWKSSAHGRYLVSPPSSEYFLLALYTSSYVHFNYVPWFAKTSASVTEDEVCIPEQGLAFSRASLTLRTACYLSEPRLLGLNQRKGIKGEDQTKCIMLDCNSISDHQPARLCSAWVLLCVLSWHLFHTVAT